MRILGISALSHDAAVALVDGEQVVFAAHAERYSRVKNDAELNQALLDDALSYGEPDLISWYERPLLKKTRHLRARQWRWACTASDIPRRHLRRLTLGRPCPPIRYVRHHESHAAAGFFTSGFPDATVLTADGLGEWQTTTIGSYDSRSRYRPLRSIRYPHSLGLLYSAVTQRCGFKPNEEEYIVMGMASFGEPRFADAIRRELLDIGDGTFRLRRNVHRGIGQWRPEAEPADLAASVQLVTEEALLSLARWARRHSPSANLVLMGGVALNCVANSRIAREAGFEKVHILPNPGDAGSSLGAAAAVVGRALEWPGPYLGHDIRRPFDVRSIAAALEAGQVVGVANGRAEFGPRALGNRSLLTDPRPAEAKDRVNRIKQREPFRPFAPVVLEQEAGRLFDLVPPRSPYMQFVARCRDPSGLAAVTHVDGTSRVQTLARSQHAKLFDLLTEFHRRTGCPALLNTSLNVKGEPLVNTWEDATRFRDLHAVPIF
ncbi:MAG: Nodulation protein nolO [uncultured Acidimicrobiales bacterium]|uniref:Nodulation protein nolO n=1 Tax=uncultured Acidimicrobiales bacterium TaxID=310071 RepID=A0A6J4IA57_9ACTN|nr:MAG: Nodulation protein nolO [uncultured Acidimicrobiales bacterium]